jgi:hypothetical protein
VSIHFTYSPDTRSFFCESCEIEVEAEFEIEDADDGTVICHVFCDKCNDEAIVPVGDLQFDESVLTWKKGEGLGMDEREKPAVGVER